MEVKNYQQWAKNVFGQCCYAACLSYLCRKSSDPITITLDILNGIKNGFIDFEDSYVSKPVDYLKVLGLQVRDIKKVDIEYLNDLPDEGLYAVEYQWNGGSHFVVAKKGSVVFDPSGDSNSVKYGRPISYRKFLY